MSGRLPPGQRARPDMPPFGLPWFAHRTPRAAPPLGLEVRRDGRTLLRVSADELARLERHEQTSPFHCVTSWTRPDPRWGGVRLRELYAQLVLPRIADPGGIARLGFVGADGFRDALVLGDALAADVLLADRLDGRPLPLAHGAPLRLVAPAHYGYKNVKHLVALELLGPARPRRFSLHHPRARVAHEERVLGAPDRLARLVYRANIGPTRWWWRRWTSA